MGRNIDDVSVRARIITGSQKVSPRDSEGLKKVSPIIEKVSPDWTMVFFEWLNHDIIQQLVVFQSA